MTPEEAKAMREWWNPHYIHAARVAFPDICADHELAVGWKITNPDGTTRNGYYWPLVNGDHDLPVLHRSDAWDSNNKDACPSREGDGLCLIPQHALWREATSGGVRFASCVGHVLVYPVELSRGTDGKRRAPWVIDVDCFQPLANLTGADLYGADLYGADLTGANLTGAYLTGADLYRADLYRADLTRANLTGVNLTGAYLTGADLTGANLYRADLTGANLTGVRYNASTVFPTGFDPAAHGMVKL